MNINLLRQKLLIKVHSCWSYLIWNKVFQSSCLFIYYYESRTRDKMIKIEKNACTRTKSQNDLLISDVTMHIYFVPVYIMRG